MTAAPRRRYTMTITVDGDTPRDLVRAVQALASDYATMWPEPLVPALSDWSCHSPGRSWLVQVHEDPTQTPERYAEQLRQYVQKERAARKGEEEG